MGQAVVDLPDPMEKPPAGASADDLLSQLAGDEIDRLLGESDVKTDPTEPEPVATIASTVEAPLAAAPAEMAEQLGTAKADASAELDVHAAALPEASGELDQSISADADAVLGAAPTEPPSDAEREGLLATIGESADTNDQAPSVPLLLRPLEWLSLPLEGLSPTTRDFLGKAAIVTVVNSAAVIAYVIWFRK
jgi:hypothetical protein